MIDLHDAPTLVSLVVVPIRRPRRSTVRRVAAVAAVVFYVLVIACAGFALAALLPGPTG